MLRLTTILKTNWSWNYQQKLYDQVISKYRKEKGFHNLRILSKKNVAKYQNDLKMFTNNCKGRNNNVSTPPTSVGRIATRLISNKPYFEQSKHNGSSKGGVTAKDKKSKQSNWSNVPEEHPIIYMKALDVNLCIPFCSEKGREIFKRAIQTEYMNIYFPLSQHFQTQSEVNYCGPTSLAMVLNTLKVDPRRMWKYPWRWYDEYMLNTCVSLETMKSSGCSFDDLACIARCNKLSVEAVRVSALSSIITFRNDVKRVCSSTNTVIILNYARKIFNQYGTGHFTPIGGYDEKEDMVLILDTARFKHPPHWVSLELLFEGARKLARAINGYTEEMPRGYYVVKENEWNPSITLKFPNEYTLRLEPMNQRKQIEIDKFVHVFKSWDNWLDTKVNADRDIIRDVLTHILHASRTITNNEIKSQSNSFHDLALPLSFVNLNRLLKDVINEFSQDDVNKITSLVKWLMEKFKSNDNAGHCNLNMVLLHRQTQTEKHNAILSLEDILTCFLLFWPYRAKADDQSSQTYRTELHALVADDLNKFSRSLVLCLDQQIRFMMKTLSHIGHEKLHCKEEHYFD